MTNDWHNAEEHEIDDVVILRSPTSISAMDGTTLRGHIYRRETPVKRSRKPLPTLERDLLCIPSELGNFRELHQFALRVMALPGAPNRIHILTLRGRDEPVDIDLDDTDHDSDAVDLISYCDALNLHHCDLLVAGRAIATVMKAVPKRPTLINRLILLDGAPAFDPVELARRLALQQRQTAPRTWENAVENLKQIDGKNFPAYRDDEWLARAQMIWCDEGSYLTAFAQSELKRLSNAVSYDEAQPLFWLQFKIVAKNPLLLVRGEHSTMVTHDVVSQMKALHPTMQVFDATGQGHIPQAHMGVIPEQVLGFMRQDLEMGS